MINIRKSINVFNTIGNMSNEEALKIINASHKEIPNDIDQPGILNLIITLEEFSEASKEISKYIRGKGNRDHLVEELADSLLSIKYVQEILNISDRELETVMKNKLLKQKKIYMKEEE